jgi:hypothetical protein
MIFHGLAISSCIQTCKICWHNRTKTIVKFIVVSNIPRLGGIPKSHMHKNTYGVGGLQYMLSYYAFHKLFKECLPIMISYPQSLLLLFFFFLGSRSSFCNRSVSFGNAFIYIIIAPK